MFVDDTRHGEGTTNPEATSPFPHILLPCVLFLVLTLLTSVLYFRSLSCPFLWDEYTLILDNVAQGVFEWHRLPSLFTHRYFYIPGREPLWMVLPYYRPLAVLFHGVTYNLFGAIPLFFHLESLLLHAANALLLFLCLSPLLSSDRPSETAEAVALASSLLFLVHPRNVETVCIIANQTGLLCTFFSLLSLCFWARVLTGTVHPRLLYGLSLLALFLAMLAKETAFSVPLLHALLFLLFGRKGRKRCFLPLAGFFLLIGVPFLLRQTFLQGPWCEFIVRELSTKGSLFTHLGSVVALFLHQLDQWFFPFDIQLFQYSFFPEELTTREVLGPVLVCVVVVWMLRREPRTLALGLGWFVIVYLPSSNLIPMGSMDGGGLKTGAHHLYLAQPGLVLLVASAIFSGQPTPPGRPFHVRSRFLPWLLTCVLILVLSCQTYRFSGFYQTADKFYQGLLKRNPGYRPVWQNYAWHKLYLDHEPSKAELILLDGLETLKVEGKQLGVKILTKNLLDLYRENGRQEEAETLLQCIQKEWIDDAIGNIYFWRYVKAQEQGKIRALPRQEDPPPDAKPGSLLHLAPVGQMPSSTTVDKSRQNPKMVIPSLTGNLPDDASKNQTQEFPFT